MFGLYSMFDFGFQVNVMQQKKIGFANKKCEMNICPVSGWFEKFYDLTGTTGLLHLEIADTNAWKCTKARFDTNKGLFDHCDAKKDHCYIHYLVY